MGTFSIWHWLIVGLVVMLLFGRGKISELMGDVAKGIKAFKKGMSDDNDPNAPQKAADPQPQAHPQGAIPGKPVERPAETPRV